MTDAASPAVASSDRRHDLDALRGFAMLLGIALHAALSFAPFPWPVQDSRQHGLFTAFFLTVHAFRMPLFFVVSGFFTAMLWRKAGAVALLKHRMLRVLLPLLLGLITIIPAMHWISQWAMRSPRAASTSPPASGPESRFVEALQQGDQAAITALLGESFDVNAHDPRYRVTLLAWASLAGDLAAVQGLLDRGADVNATNAGDGSSAAHGAAFRGSPEILRLLKERGANLSAINHMGGQPRDALKADQQTTEAIGRALGLPERSFAEIQAGREECRTLFPADPLATLTPPAWQVFEDTLQRVRQFYATCVGSDFWRVTWPGGRGSTHLLLDDMLAHLWFLWFLCWLVALFVLATPMLKWFGQSDWLRAMVLSPARGLVLIALGLVPQLFMGAITPIFGPDTSTSLLPQPHVLAYYAVFFAFGALYFEADDVSGRVGRGWLWTLPLAFFVALPLALATWKSPLLTAVPQLTYTWLVIFGLFGVFRRFASRSRPAIRYLSDASYWLYLTHLPLVMVGQQWVRDWPLPSGVKFVTVCVSTTLLLLLIYQLCVRYTWVGAMLNGRKRRIPEVQVVASREK
ncbi:MAG: acyltransferase family protein [Pirellulales bacterium]